MDNAAITDSQGRKADFRNVVVIFTTNAGSEKAASLGFGSSQQNTFRDTAIKSLFKPEFRNRLDETVFFSALPPAVILQVVHKFVKELEGQLATRKVTINVTDAACEWFASKGFDPVFGARPMARLIQRELKNKLADEILFGALKDGGVVRVGLHGDALSFEMEREGAV
jgi:ATP-dependent Clp protease ATP-binding subunit ClpA